MTIDINNGKSQMHCIKVSKGAKIRNHYNQVPHLTKDTNGKSESGLLQLSPPHDVGSLVHFAPPHDVGGFYNLPLPEMLVVCYN